MGAPRRTPGSLRALLPCRPLVRECPAPHVAPPHPSNTGPWHAGCSCLGPGLHRPSRDKRGGPGVLALVQTLSSVEVCILPVTLPVTLPIHGAGERPLLRSEGSQEATLFLQGPLRGPFGKKRCFSWTWGPQTLPRMGELARNCPGTLAAQTACVHDSNSASPWTSHGLIARQCGRQDLKSELSGRAEVISKWTL